MQSSVKGKQQMEDCPHEAMDGGPHSAGNQRIGLQSLTGCTAVYDIKDNYSESTIFTGGEPLKPDTSNGRSIRGHMCSQWSHMGETHIKTTNGE